MRTKALLISVVMTFAGVSASAEKAAPASGTGPAAKKSGFTVKVEFFVDSAGVVTDEHVLASDEPLLNDFALPIVKSGRLNPAPLPPPGSEPRLVTSDLFFPVEAYDSGKPLPAGVIMPKPRFQPIPPYPFEYRNKGITGGARISLTVGKTGKVIGCKVIKASHPNFGLVAVDAVSKWIFRPATLNGEPIEVTVNVPISFELEGKPHEWRWLVAPAPSLERFALRTNPG